MQHVPLTTDDDGAQAYTAHTSEPPAVYRADVYADAPSSSGE